MSDIQDDRPDNQIPSEPAPEQTAPAPQTPDAPATEAVAAQAPSAPAVPPPPAQPAAEAAAAAAQTAPAAPAASESAPAAPTSTASSVAPSPAPSAPPAPPVFPVPPAGYPAGAQAYARPQGYAGQPAGPQTYAGQPASAPSYAGQPTGAAFGVGGDAQPTLPIHGAPETAPAPAAAKKPSGVGKVVGLLVAAAIVGGAAGLGGAYAGTNLFAPTSTSPAAGPETVTINDRDGVTRTTAIAAKVVPSVVTISASSSNGGGTGSGVILTEDGYVVTNTHVVTLDGATGNATVRVTTSDGRVYDAEVVGLDPLYDLAVIKLEGAEGLTPIEFADSSDLNVGDETIAVGAPLGLANTVTTGIVSALNRSISIASSAAPDAGDEEEVQPDEQDGPFRFDFGQPRQPSGPSQTISIAVIQTDAAINPGNSGGALVDAEGRLIGINVAIATAGGSSQGSGSIGVGFAIPSDIVSRVTDELIENGEATHGLLGASVRPAASVEGAEFTGAYIAEIVPDGAAAAAGLQEGDVVTSFNGVPITDATDLTAQVRALAAGSDAELTFVRDGESRTVEVTLGTLTQ